MIDTHHHYPTEALIEAFRSRTEPPCVVEAERLISPFRSQGTTGRGEAVRFGHDHFFALTPELLELDVHLRHMDVHGIEVAVLSTNAPGVDALPEDEAVAVARACNDEMAERCASSEGRFVGLATLPMCNPQAAADELERALSLGLVGAQIFSNVNGEDVHDARFRPVFVAAGELRTTIRLHPTSRPGETGVSRYCLQTAIGFIADTSSAALGLIFSGLFDEYEDFRLVIPHVGGVLPFAIERVDHEAQRLRSRGGAGAIAGTPRDYIRRLYTDAACPGGEATHPALMMAIDVFGSEHVMLGTDYPHWHMRTALRAIDHLPVSDSQLAAIKRGTARELFGIGRVTDTARCERDCPATPKRERSAAHDG